MKNLIRLLAVIALMATASAASAAQVFVFNGSSVDSAPLPSLCGVALCSGGVAPNDFVLTLTLDDAVTSISHSDPGTGSTPAGFVSIVLATKSSAAAPLTIFQTICEDAGAVNNVLPNFEELNVLVVAGVVRELKFGFIDALGPNPRGGMNADSSFTFGVSFGPDSLSCDPFSATPAPGCTLWNNPWIAFESGDFNGAPIPVPAAVWLFGSALGLLGWVRRRA